MKRAKQPLNPELYKSLTTGMSEEEQKEIGYKVYLADDVFITKSGKYISEDEDSLSQT